ncbi:MAG: methylmalonyl-CoA mutase [Pseudonocardia sp.]|nr:methylmalonyl-CoA mutase [Pseudonocardia sp.]
MTVPSEPSDQTTLTLAAEFPPATRAEWRDLLTGVLSKAGLLPENLTGPVEDLLGTSIAEGVTVAPLYVASDAANEAPGMPGLAPFVRGARPLGSSPDGWDLRQRHTDPDVAATKEAVLTDLANGVTSLWLVLGEGALPVDSLPVVLRDVLLELVPIALDAGSRTAQAAEALFALAAERQIPAGALAGTLGADPLGWLAGLDADTDTDAGLALTAILATRCVTERPNLRAVTVDATVYHNAGADDAQELGCSLAAGVAYLRALTDAGMPVNQALTQLEFRYSATADQFATIAKLRAARGLWARVARDCTGGERPGPQAAQRQHAVTSEPMLTARDPWVNMLRVTLACFTAGVGGANAVTVLPFDAALGLPNQFSRRIARNTQSLLIHESHLARVVDPAGGSWYVERLTTTLARRAWEVFTKIERDGGLLATLRDGSLADALAKTWDARADRLATRKEPVLGVSEFPHLAETLPDRRPDRRPAPHGLLPRVRRAAAFEALRDRADAHLAATGARPAVFLAALGSPAAHNARSSFAANLFQAGGMATPTGSGSPEQIAAAFAQADTTIACLCGTDSSYAEQGQAVAEALRAHGARNVLLAGKPGTLVGKSGGSMDDAAVGGYVHAGCNAVAVLRETLDELGVRA